MFDVTKFVADLHDYIGKALNPIFDRIKALESRAAIPGERGEKGESGQQGERGKDGDRGEQGLAGEKGDAGKDGKDAEPIILQDVIAELAVAPEIKTVLSLLVAETVLQEVAKALPAAVDAHLKAHPPKDGRDGNDGRDGSNGEPGEKGADGVGLASFIANDKGEMIATNTKGEVFNLGQYRGKDGRDGADGKDGIGLDAFELFYVPETHEIEVKASAAGRTKELRYPAGGIRHAGFWNDGQKYLAGQAVTHDGHCWIALRETSAKPAYENSKCWALMVRKGRDGRDGKDGKSAPEPVRMSATEQL